MSNTNLLREVNQKLNICDDLSIEKNKNLIFVYCPPKVGSTTIVSSIRMSACNKFTVLHIHDELMLQVLCGVNSVKIIDIIKYNSQLGKNVYVIDSYRSPIEQKISKFFEKLSTYHFNNSPLLINNYDVNKIIKRFNSLFPHITIEDHYKDLYEIPFPEKFDTSNKYLIQNIENIKYIKLRLKDANYWGNILSNILGTEIFMIKDYETNNKPIRDMFKKFNETYKIPINLLKIIEECSLLNYYYSDKEREEYLNTWRTKQTEEFVSFTLEENDFYNKISKENKYMNEIQRTHYLDEGCSCKACSFKREQLLNRIRKGENVTDKIIHDNAKIEYINKKANEMKVITVHKQLKKYQNKNQQKFNTLFRDSINKKF
jgi:hypothetical protein